MARVVTIRANKREYRKVGRLAHAIAKKIGVRAGDIMIDDHTLAHIFNNHRTQLEMLGVSPELFTRMVLTNYNQIYEGHDGRLLIVCNEGGDHNNTAVIGMLMRKDKRNVCFWEVVTASPRRADFFKNKQPVYEKRKTG